MSTRIATDGIDLDDNPTLKRRRGPTACATCRQRKVRCDGTHPCANCRSSGGDCFYGVDPITKGKSDAILETVLRLEERITRLSTRLGLDDSQSEGIATVRSPNTAISEPPSITGARQLVQDARSRNNANLDNATLSAQHASTAESVLTWPYFDVFPSLRTNHRPLFTSEQQRSRLLSSSSTELPVVDRDALAAIVQAFQAVVNFSYPTISAFQLADAEHRVATRQADESVEWSQALLVMALGCASQVVQSLERRHRHEHSSVSHSRHLALAYFSLHLQGLGRVYADISTTATRCHFLMALFYAYLQRPLQAWSNINTAAAKCRVLLSYTSSDAGEDTECLRRVFWSCFILESDYVAELAALPQSGVGEMESSVPYPAHYRTCDDETTREQSSLYFLACVSMRRLLNRVHDLLYAMDTGVAFDDARFPHVVVELDHQLEEWWRCLPSEFQFSIDTQPAKSEQGGFLRQRYLTCRAVIYRPYLNKVLSQYESGNAISTQMLDRSEVCLNMCLLHILNLRPFSQTVMVDTWICSLSMASTMLILLAATRMPLLKDRLDSRVLDAGRHLAGLIQQWEHVHGDDVSPSVSQSLWMIREADYLIQQEMRHCR